MSYKPMPFRGIGRGYLESSHPERIRLVDAIMSSSVILFGVSLGLAIALHSDYNTCNESCRTQRSTEARMELASFSYAIADKYKIPFLDNLFGRRTIGDLLR